MNKNTKIITVLLLVYIITIFNFMPFTVNAGITDGYDSETSSRTTVVPHYDEYNMWQNLDLISGEDIYIDGEYALPFVKVFGLDNEDYVFPTFYSYDSNENKMVVSNENDAIFKIVKVDDSHFQVLPVNEDKFITTEVTFLQGCVDELYDSHTYFTGVTFVNDEGIPIEDPSAYVVSGHAIYEYRREDYYNRYQLMLQVNYGTLEYIKGDLDGNNVVDANDASVALELYKAQNATSQDIQIGDMDNNSLIDANDASLILEYFKTHQ